MPQDKAESFRRLWRAMRGNFSSLSLSGRKHADADAGVWEFPSSLRGLLLRAISEGRPRPEESP
jgi:hypothetical protein